MASPEEIQFSKTRRSLAHEIEAFIDAYAKEAGVEAIRYRGGMAGPLLGHTLQGHDLAIERTFCDKEIPEHTEYVGVRIRHEQWRAKVTIWGAKSMMESFFCDSLTDEVRSKLMDCIDKTITQA